MPHVGSRLFALLFLVVECAPQSATSTVDEEALAEPPGAYNLVHHSGNGTQAISYALDEPYPAEKFLAQLAHSLSRMGWTPLPDSWFNPGSPSSHASGWSDFEDGSVSPSLHVDQWMADWVSADGAVLSYTLKYSYPLGEEPNRDTLSVAAVVLSPEAAVTFQNQLAMGQKDVDRMMEAEQQVQRAQEKREAATVRRGATRHGRLQLRLLYKGASIPDPTAVLSSSFDEQVPPLELEIVQASVEIDPASGVVIRAVFSESSARKVHEFSSVYPERVAAIIVDEEVIATPFFAGPVEDIMMIHGAFTRARANEIIDRMMK